MTQTGEKFGYRREGTLEEVKTYFEHEIESRTPFRDRVMDGAVPVVGGKVRITIEAEIVNVRKGTGYADEGVVWDEIYTTYKPVHGKTTVEPLDAKLRT